MRSLLACSLGALLLGGCATVHPAPLPPAPADAGEELAAAHAIATEAYDGCSESYVEDQVNWRTYAASGAGAGAAALQPSAVAPAAPNIRRSRREVRPWDGVGGVAMEFLPRWMR